MQLFVSIQFLALLQLSFVVYSLPLSHLISFTDQLCSRRVRSAPNEQSTVEPSGRKGKRLRVEGRNKVVWVYICMLSLIVCVDGWIVWRDEKLFFALLRPATRLELHVFSVGQIQTQLETQPNIDEIKK